ncbi:hypothetical protein PG999_011890 [Apiospora kogelbergensis]|uniref:Uncharacterized protein n=1 Tax=Apiospora kogelbergensis TaxID=1337665 RepID=A0AAW0QIH3_9PEZI
MDAEKPTTGRTASQQKRASVNPFKEIFEISMKTIEIEEKDYEEKLSQWRDCDEDDLDLAEAALALSRGRLKEEADNAERVVESAQGYAGIREESVQLMRTVRRVRREHIGESSSS